MLSVSGATTGIAVGILVLASYPLQTLIAVGVVLVLGVAAWRIASARRRPEG